MSYITIPAALTEKVSEKPLKVDVLSRTVTIWRGEDGQVAPAGGEGGAG